MAITLQLSNVGVSSGPGTLASPQFTYIPGPHGEDFILVSNSSSAGMPQLWQVRYNQDGSPWWQFVTSTPSPTISGQIIAVAAGHGWWPVDVGGGAVGQRMILNGMILGTSFSVRTLSVSGMSCAPGSTLTTTISSFRNARGQEFLLPIVAPSTSPLLGPTSRQPFAVLVDSQMPVSRPGRAAGQSFSHQESAQGWDVGPLPGADGLTDLHNTPSFLQVGKWLYCWGGYVHPWSGSAWGTAALAAAKIWRADVSNFTPGATLAWVESGVLPQGIQRQRVCSWRRWLLSVGGFTTTAVGTGTDTTEIWAARSDMDVQAFVKVADMPVLKNRGALWTHEERIYHLGGFQGSTVQSDCWWGRLEEILT